MLAAWRRKVLNIGGGGQGSEYWGGAMGRGPRPQLVPNNYISHIEK